MPDAGTFEEIAMPKRPCPFCSPADDRIVRAFDAVLVLRDGFPISPGHTLIVPRRRVGSFFDLTSDEQAGMLEALNWAKGELAQSRHPDAFNVGLNDGPAAGQTVPHCHLQLIPRHAGDVADPRGGVRWVVPSKAKYWPD
ncbi:MAG: HIT family protein [Pirellulaceae bacterium]|nr:HIT family protein [Pirellulaceae bacterium]